MSSRDNYIGQALQEVVASCDSTDQAIAAEEIFAGSVSVGRQSREKKDKKKADAVPQMPGFGNFTDKPVLEHYFAVVIPVSKGLGQDQGGSWPTSTASSLPAPGSRSPATCSTARIGPCW